MEGWYPDALATIATRLGVSFSDLAPPQSRRLRTPGGPEIHAVDWGGQGPCVVLLHGGALTARTWDYVALALRTEFRLLALDMRGHGASDWADDYSIESYAADVSAVLDGLSIERTHLAGMSLGGIVACEFALRHPGRTASLTMVDVVSRPTFAATARVRSFINDFRGASTIEEVVEMALAVSPKSDPQRLHYRMRLLLRRDDDGRLLWRADRRRPTDFAAILRHLAGLETRVHEMAAPFLLARGGDSLIVTREAAHSFTARFPNGRWLDISGAGHNVQEDNPRELVNALRDFWAGRLPSMRLDDAGRRNAQGS